VKLFCNTTLDGTQSLVRAAGNNHLATVPTLFFEDILPIEIVFLGEGGGLAPFSGQAGHEIKIAIGKLSTREILTQSTLDGDGKANLDLSTNAIALEMYQAEQKTLTLEIQISYDTGKTETLCQVPCTVQNQLIGELVVPNAPGEINAEILTSPAAPSEPILDSSPAAPSAINSIHTDFVNIYILAGQSNAHGAADVAALDSSLHTQEGLFYTSWHNDTSNASSNQNYSNWETSLVAGSTRGDSNNLVNSLKFGSELGFVNQANAVDLANGNTIGIIKHAIGASTLVDDATDSSGGLSDWDLTATGNRRGDALRAFKLAVVDATTKLTSAGYNYKIAGVIWWQGESGSSVNGLNALISHFRDWFDSNYTLDMPKEHFPFVITKIGYGTDLTPVASADSYVGIVDAGSFGHSNTNNHIGTSSNPDTTSTGVNDMFEIGQAFADKMALAISGNTNPWTPADITTRLWLDMDDQATFTSSGGNVTAIADKSGNNYTFSAASGSTLTAVNTSQNGKNILRFDNNSDATSWKTIDFPSAVHRYYFVVKVTASDNHDALVTIHKSNPTHQMIMFNLSGNGVFSGDWFMSPGTHITSNSSNLLNQWVMLNIELDVPNTRATASLNGTPYNTNSAQSGLSNYGQIKVKLNDYQNNADSDWGEAIFIEDATQSESDKIEGYLAHKWGLEADLPTDHPYKNSAP